MNKKSRLEEFTRAAFPEEYFDKAKAEFRDYYLTNQDTLQAATKAFRNLIVLLLKGQQFPDPKVSSRLKDRSEAVRKFERKYRSEFEDNGDDYKISEHITDMIGVRVVCIYESDIDKVADILKGQFEVIETTDKSKEVEGTINTFGYKGLHLDLRLNAARMALPEYSRFADLRFECQIRSIVQDAWSEVDHKLKYKKQTPERLQRRIVTLAALFEMADREFDTIRELSSEIEATAVERTRTVDEERTGLDLVGFLGVANDFFPNYEFWGGEALENLMGEIFAAKSNITIADFRQALSKNLAKTQEYKDYLLRHGHNMAPYTQVRHALYAHDPRVFGSLIFQNHRKNFDRWLEHGTVHPAEIKKK